MVSTRSMESTRTWYVDRKPSPFVKQCTATKKLNDPRIGTGEELADKVARQSAGLGRAGFLAYLEWLLGAKDNASPYEENSELPITLFDTSFAGGVKSREFKNLKQLADWAEPFILSYKSAQTAATPDPTPSSSSSPKNSGSGGFSGKNHTYIEHGAAGQFATIMQLL